MATGGVYRTPRSYVSGSAVGTDAAGVTLTAPKALIPGHTAVLPGTGPQTGSSHTALLSPRAGGTWVSRCLRVLGICRSLGASAVCNPFLHVSIAITTAV